MDLFGSNFQSGVVLKNRNPFQINQDVDLGFLGINMTPNFLAPRLLY
jgi:hypothetical protein